MGRTAIMILENIRCNSVTDLIRETHILYPIERETAEWKKDQPVEQGRELGTTEVIALTPQQKYDKVHTKFIGLKLNRKTDHDILSVLEGKSKQTEIKRLVRLGLAAEQKDAEKEQG